MRRRGRLALAGVQRALLLQRRREGFHSARAALRQQTPVAGSEGASRLDQAAGLVEARYGAGNGTMVYAVRLFPTR